MISPFSRIAVAHESIVSLTHTTSHTQKKLKQTHSDIRFQTTFMQRTMIPER